MEAEDKNGKIPAQLAGKGAHRLLINQGAMEGVRYDGAPRCLY